MDALETRTSDNEDHINGNGSVRPAADVRPGKRRTVTAASDPLPSPTVVRAVGTIGLACWFLVFVVGLLVSSLDYRDALLPPPRAAGGTIDLAELGQWPSLVASIVVMKAALTFSPINIGLLCVTAGLVGGCAANLSWFSLERQEATAVVSPRRSAFLTEHPANAVMRSFVIYLLLMAGLLAFMPDPFKLLEVAGGTDADGGQFRRDLVMQQASYTRLAALASILSFMVGYDPSRFDGFFDLVPRLSNGNGHGHAGKAPASSPVNGVEPVERH
jgi:hypothetical protein